MTTKKQPMVSVIIPVYNCEEYLQRCLDSIFGQTYTDFEVIAIDDGSHDSSLVILRDNAKRHSNMTVMSHKNHGQGYTRNKALRHATGEYILFVDSDDFIEPLTLELTLARIVDDASDFVHFDWKFSKFQPGEADVLESLPRQGGGRRRATMYHYLNKEPYMHKKILEGGECDELLQMPHFFSVNNLYRKSFLDKHNIKYGEKGLYEDIIFVTLAANNAEKISLLHSPLYIIHRNPSSSTRTKAKDDTHYKSFIHAVKESLNVFKPRMQYSGYYLIKYFQTKFIFYYLRRVPRQYKASYLKDYVDAIGDTNIVIPNGGQPDRIMRLSLKYRVFKDRNYKLFATIIFIKTQLLVRRDKAVHHLRRTKKSINAVLRPSAYARYQRHPLDEKMILFLGFDYRYTGNSRYLFEEFLESKASRGFTVKFATSDELPDPTVRVEPYSDEFYRLIARSKCIIAESWIPGFIKKREGMVWVQLWHGTPTKKMLFDSNEAEIVRNRPGHKVSRYRDILNWDYLVVDSRAGAEKFKSAFLYPWSRMISSGYPRVKYIIDNKHNTSLKDEIKRKIGLDKELMEKKIVLYAPTWRDYNSSVERNDQDHSYIMDINRFADVLGDDYLVFYHDHHYLSQFEESQPLNCLDVSSYETQELLLVADYLVSDYSSIIYDAFAINLPVTLFVNDFEKYSKSRGVYADIWEDLKPLAVDSVNEVAQRVKSGKLDDRYALLAQRYGYDAKANLADVIARLDT